MTSRRRVDRTGRPLTADSFHAVRGACKPPARRAAASARVLLNRSIVRAASDQSVSVGLPRNGHWRALCAAALVQRLSFRTCSMQAASAPNGFVRRAKAAARDFCPKPLLLWREARYFEKYGERELRLVRYLCQRERDAVDVGAHEGSYVHFMKRHARRVYAFEPVPSLAEALAWKFAPRVVVRNIALSRESGTAILRIPLIEGAALTGLASLNDGAGATTAITEIAVQTRPLDEVFAGDAGFIKVDVEGHEEAVLDGAARTIARCRPRLLIEIEEGRMPGAPSRIHAFLRRFNYRGYFVCGR
ncbi:MAG: FkbM family methyltransferase, partial [Stellaceae bacterium]